MTESITMMKRRIKREAELRGDMFFYHGVPCKRGHDCARYTKSGDCVMCVREYEKKRRQRK